MNKLATNIIGTVIATALIAVVTKFVRARKNRPIEA